MERIYDKNATALQQYYTVHHVDMIMLCYTVYDDIQTTSQLLKSFLYSAATWCAPNNDVIKSTEWLRERTKVPQL